MYSKFEESIPSDYLEIVLSAAGEPAFSICNGLRNIGHGSMRICNWFSRSSAAIPMSKFEESIHIGALKMKLNAEYETKFSMFSDSRDAGRGLIFNTAFILCSTDDSV